jgi:tetratricopeptide (TPR) repeat protein
LAKVYPDNASWQRDLSVACNKVGDVLKAQGNLADALQAYRDSLAIIERLAKIDPSNAGWQRDLSVSYERVGNVLMAQGNLADALQVYRDCLAIGVRLANADPSNAGWQRDLWFSYYKVGDVLAAQGNLSEALQAYRDSLAVRERLAKAEPGNRQWQNDLQYIVGRIGDLAHRFVLAGTFVSALETADQAISLAPEQIWLYADRAHALMLLDRVDEARAIYMQYRGNVKARGDKTWHAVILGDFDELREAGLTHPLMDEIESKLAAGG